MLSSKPHTPGMKVSAFLRDEKRSCKQIQKQILSEQVQPWRGGKELTDRTEDMPAAMPHGKGFTVVAEDIKAAPGQPSVIAKILWKKKRSGADVNEHIAGPPAHNVLLALTTLRDKAREMARAQK